MECFQPRHFQVFAGLAVNAKDSGGGTPLTKLAKLPSITQRHRLAVQMLLDEGADNTSTDLVSGRTALDWAVLIGHESLLNTLLVHSDVCSTEKDLMVLLTNIYYLVRTNADNEVRTLCRMRVRCNCEG